MKFFIFIFMILACEQITAQELFTWSEPASNMPAKSIGLRATNTLMRESSTNNYNYHLLPEVMVGISGKLMFHVEVFFSSRDNGLSAEGAALYVKYRFLSQDEVHSHFRMALYARGSYNNSDIHQPAIDMNGHNSGYEAGFIATKLVNKVAVSVGAGYLHAVNNGNGNKIYAENKYRNAVNYNLSIGKLMLPKEYKSYEQTNLNLMLEMLGQTNMGNGKTFLDLAPTIQFIFLSKMRIDAGYRFALLKDLERTTPGGFLLRFEYNIFSAFK